MGTAVDYLIDAPKVTRDIAPMSWQFLDAPPDGTVMLQWQPLGHMGTHAATDGYVWPGPEALFTTQNRNYVWRMLEKRMVSLLTSLSDRGGVLSEKWVSTSRRKRYDAFTEAVSPAPNFDQRPESSCSRPIFMDRAVFSLRDAGSYTRKQIPCYG